MISSEDIKESIVKKLLLNFPNVAVYKEAITSPKYPHFFINQINVQDVEERKNHHVLSYLIMIRYRVTSDPNTDLSLQTDLDKVGFELLQKFNLLEFNDSKVRCMNKNVEKVDGVLHFNFNIDLSVFDKSEIENIKMNKLEYKLELKK